MVPDEAIPSVAVIPKVEPPGKVNEPPPVICVAAVAICRYELLMTEKLTVLLTVPPEV